MDQSELYGRVIKVNQAKPLKNHDEGLGSRTAVWEQVCMVLNFNAEDISKCADHVLLYRKATPPNTMSKVTMATRKGRVLLRTRCKVWRGLRKRDQRCSSHCSELFFASF